MAYLIYPICEKKRFRKNEGTSKIYLQYNYSSNLRPLLDTELAIPPHCWNKSARRVTNKLPDQYGDYKQLNEEIKRQEELAQDLVRLGVRMRVANIMEFVKEYYLPNLDITELSGKKDLFERLAKPPEERTNINLFFQLEEYIKSKEGRVSPKTINIFQQIGHHLRAYEKFANIKVGFESLTYDFYDKYTRFLTFDYVHERRKTQIKGLRTNSISKTIKQLRIFVRDRVKRKIIPPIDLSDFKCSDEESDAIYLSINDIRKIYQLDLSYSPLLAQYRRIFIIACLTGLRFSDFSTIEPGDVLEDVFIYKKQEKTEKPVVIPLRKEARELLQEYFEHKHLVNLTNGELNTNVKVLGRLAGITTPVTFSYKKGATEVKETRAKCDWITTHTARRSFCTNEFLAGTPVKLIMKISGHKKEKDFYRYIRITEKEAALLIERIWLARDGMQPLALIKEDIQGD